MIREVKFESQDRRIKQILACLNKHGIASIEEANEICEAAGLDPYKTCEETQMICFENAKWAYVVGTAIALKEKAKDAVEAANYIGEGLQSFCIPGSVADDRKVGIGHGELAARLLSPETKCFAFLAGHESFAAAEGLKIYYTLDGSEPTTASTLYEAAFDLTETTTVMAIAVDAEGNASPVAKAMYTIKATPVAPENGALFNFNENKWNLPVSSSEETFPITEVKEGDVTLTFTNGSTPTRLWNDFNNGLQIRMYKNGGSMTVTPAADQKVVKVEFDATKLDVTASEGTLAEKVWTGEAATVTFTANATSNINYIIVTLSKQSGIEGVEAGEQTEKVIYTIDGRRVQKAEKGVYVINGKKVLVK